jgi:hypothetical protein
MNAWIWNENRAAQVAGFVRFCGRYGLQQKLGQVGIDEIARRIPAKQGGWSYSAAHFWATKTSFTFLSNGAPVESQALVSKRGSHSITASDGMYTLEQSSLSQP